MSTPAQTLFGRKYRLSIYAQTSQNGPVEKIVVSDSDWEPFTLKFSFDIEKVAVYQTFWNSSIKIYNCDGPIPKGPSKGTLLSNLIIKEGMTVEVEAGYYNGPFGLIWSGQIFQPIWTRENVVDFVLELRCIQGRLYGTNNFINQTGSPYQTAKNEAQFIAEKSVVPIPYTPEAIDTFDDSSLTKDPYPSTHFGNPSDVINGLASESSLLFWIGQNGMGTTDLTKKLGPVAASYAPQFSPGSTPQTPAPGVSQTLIGTPRQTILGADWTVLLDPRMDVVVPLLKAQVDLAALELTPITISSNGAFPPRPLQTKGIYIVAGVTHTGDTRGSDWLTHITGIESVRSVLALLGDGADITGS